MEYRSFGNTGMRTSILGFGGFHLLEIPQAEAGWLLNAYLDAGGNYIETAASYGDGESERKIGLSVAHRRADFVLTSKTGERTAAGAAASIDRSLKNLRTDHLDLLLMHAVDSVQTLDAILAPGGAVEAALAAQKAGKLRFIGISMHGEPTALIEALNRGAGGGFAGFDAVMSTINYYDRCNYPEIEDTLLPLAAEKGVGVILMKPVADGYLYRSAPAAFRYAFSRPVSVVVAGINNRQMLADDLAYAEAHAPMGAAQVAALMAEAPELGNTVCRQCGKCACPTGVNIMEVFAAEGWYDRQMASGAVNDTAQYALEQRLRFWFGNQQLGRDRYAALGPAADATACDGCGACLPQCPYGIDIPAKLHHADYKLAGREIF